MKYFLSFNWYFYRYIAEEYQIFFYFTPKLSNEIIFVSFFHKLIFLQVENLMQKNVRSDRDLFDASVQLLETTCKYYRHNHGD